MTKHVVLNWSDLFVVESNYLQLCDFRDGMTKRKDYGGIHQKQRNIAKHGPFVA